MNEQQFHIIADKVLRKPLQRKAAFDVIFKGIKCHVAERKYSCAHNTVYKSVAIIRAHYDHCVTVVSAR